MIHEKEVTGKKRNNRRNVSETGESEKEDDIECKKAIFTLKVGQ